MKTNERPRRARAGRSGSRVAQPRRSEETRGLSRQSVAACSLCLRVRSGSGWIEADEAIRKLRSFELASPLRLAPGVCDRCSDLIRARRKR